LADQDEVLIPACQGGMPPPARRIATPFQRVAGQQDGAGDEPVGSSLIVTADVDQQGAGRLRGVRLRQQFSAVFAVR
jgi:hypothetical protein